MAQTTRHLPNAKAVATWARLYRSQGKPVGLVNIFHGFHAGHQAAMRQARRIPGSVVLVALHQPATTDIIDALQAEGIDAWYEVAQESAHTVLYTALPFSGDMAAWQQCTRFRDFGESGQDQEVIARRITAIVRVAMLAQATDIFAGEKDYETLVSLTRAAQDLELQATVHGVSVVRMPNGVAISSANAQLDVQAAEQLVAVSAALTAAAHIAEQGAQVVVDTVEEILHSAGISPEYIFLRSRNWDVPPQQGDARLQVAVRVGEHLLCDSVGLVMGLGFKNLEQPAAD